MKGRLPGVAAALVGLALGAAASAQPAQPPSESGFKGFAITGDNPLTASETAALLAPFLRRAGSPEVLRQAAASLEGALHERGYLLYRVVLPAQAMSDTITLNVLRRTVSRVGLQGGAEHFGEANIRAALPELRERTSPNLHRLARELAIANDNPSRRLDVDWPGDGVPDALEASVRVRESRPWSVAAGWNNNGTRETGRDRLSLGASHHNLFGRSQVLSAAYATSPDRTGPVQQAGLAYRAPLPTWGGVVLAHHARSDVAGRFGVDRPDRGHAGFDATGPGRQTRLGYAHHLVQKKGRRSQLLVAVDDKRFEPSALAGQPQATGVRRTRPVSIGHAVGVDEAGTSWEYRIEFAANLARGGGNDLAAYRTENPEIGSVHWKVWRASAQATADLGAGWQWTGRMRAQYSPDLLLAGEAFGLGGPGSVRGAPERALYGDSGLSATLEGSTPPLWQGLRALAFVDAGLVRSDLIDRPVRRSKDRLASLGLGLRYTPPGGALVSADYGRLIAGSRVHGTVNPSAPARGDDKLHVNVSLVF